MKRPKSIWWAVGLFFVASCAGTQRSCASSCAQDYGADWVVVQMDNGGRSYRCWQLSDVSIANEHESDGIYWMSPDGHLVHVSGHYNRVQIDGGRWDEGLAEVGLTRASCVTIQGRRYVPEQGEWR